jgi:hypothetical protein
LWECPPSSSAAIQEIITHGDQHIHLLPCIKRGIGRRALEAQLEYGSNYDHITQCITRHCLHVEIGHVIYHIVFNLGLAEASIQKVYTFHVRTPAIPEKGNRNKKEKLRQAS